MHLVKCYFSTGKGLILPWEIQLIFVMPWSISKVSIQFYQREIEKNSEFEPQYFVDYPTQPFLCLSAPHESWSIIKAKLEFRLVASWSALSMQIGFLLGSAIKSMMPFKSFRVRLWVNSILNHCANNSFIWTSFSSNINSYLMLNLRCLIFIFSKLKIYEVLSV